MVANAAVPCKKKMKIGSLPQPGTDFEGVWN